MRHDFAQSTTKSRLLATDRLSLGPQRCGQDRTLSPFNEKRGQAGALLLSVGAKQDHCRLGRPVQQ